MPALDLIRPDLLTFKGYIPWGDDLECRLHANELPWSPLSMANVSLNHYPDPRQQKRLQEQIADYYQVDNEQMALTRGSDEGLDLIMRLFLRPGLDSIMQCPPTFPMYAVYARLQQAQIINCPLDSETDFSLSEEKLISFWQPNCKLIILCRPNNPTGNLLDLTVIARLCKQFTDKAIIVVDEAYIDFAQTPSAISLLTAYDNLLILRTLSKAYGLAGLRLGSVIGQLPLIKALRNLIPPYALANVVIDLAQRALADKDWFTTKIQAILQERTKLIRQLQQSPWLEKVYPTSANFILVASSHAQALATWCAELGIAVRYFAATPIHNMLRITVGEAAQNQRLLAALASFKG
jgi:histidinol-phosphate aminotransferase